MIRGIVRTFAATAALIVLMQSPSNAETTAKKVSAFALSFHAATSNYNAGSVDETLLKSRVFFADQGSYDSYRTAFRGSGNYEAVKKYGMTVTGKAAEAKAVKGDDGRWDVTFHAKESYRPEQGIGLDQCLDVAVKVAEKADGGLGVASVVSTACAATK
jgi:hypothetical protein